MLHVYMHMYTLLLYVLVVRTRTLMGDKDTWFWDCLFFCLVCDPSEPLTVSCLFFTLVPIAFFFDVTLFPPSPDIRANSANA